MAVVTQRDAAALLDIVAVGATDAGQEPFPSTVLLALAKLIPSDACVGYQEADVAGKFRVVELLEVVGEPPSPAVEEAIHSLGWQNPMHCRLHARERRVLRLTDLLTSRQRRRLEYETAVWRPHGIEDGLRLWLPARPGRARSIYLERSGKRYSDRERTLLSLLRPHLLRMRLNGDSRRRMRAQPNLTPREVEILGLVARGRTNGEIARSLVISPHTVRKHLENVFGKLNVHTRTAAAAAFTRFATLDLHPQAREQPRDPRAAG